MTCTRPQAVIMYGRHRKQQRPSDVEASAAPIHIARQRHGLSPLHVPEEPNKSQQKSKTSAWPSPHTTKPLSTLSRHASKRPTTCSRIAAVQSNLLPGLRVASHAPQPLPISTTTPGLQIVGVGFYALFFAKLALSQQVLAWRKYLSFTNLEDFFL